ncbi:MAG TPA: hypothetical protein VFU59_09095, partial [Candidatus Eisenbacteria bacterium]|nr:hypothetical protein [Candidatus Eisenbacteria bacterium]
MTPGREEMSFRIFWWTLGLGLLAMSLQTVVEAHYVKSHQAMLHGILVGGVEAFGAVLFLIPKTMRVGGALLIVAIMAAFVTHTTMRNVRWDLLIYMAAVFFVRAR